jgi:hypothetical protein
MRLIQKLAGGLVGVLLALLTTGLLSTSAFAQVGPVAAPGVEIALYPAPEIYRMGGIPQSFMAGQGRRRVTAVDDQRCALLLHNHFSRHAGCFMWHAKIAITTRNIEGVPIFAVWLDIAGMKGFRSLG